MSRPKERIAVSGPQSGLNAAFVGLQLEGLPAGPEVVLREGGSEPERSLKPGRAVLRRETAHRGGKTVLVVDGFGPQHSEAMIEALGKRLRNGCGSGGTVRGRVIELQGNQPGKVRELLEAEGFQVAGER